LQGIQSFFSLMENILDISPSSVVPFCRLQDHQSSLLHVLAHRILRPESSPLRTAASELLSSILHDLPDLVETFASNLYELPTADPSLNSSSIVSSGEGIEVLLVILNAHKDLMEVPSSEDVEYLANVTDVLCLCLFEEKRKLEFIQLEGFELMVACVHKVGYLRFLALKISSFATSNSKDSCVSFINAGGLKVLFPAFLGLGIGHTRKLHETDSVRREIEYSVSILSHCVNLLPADEIGRDRILTKFVEKNYEKLEKTLSMHSRYLSESAESTSFLLHRLDIIVGHLLLPSKRFGDLSFMTRSMLYEKKSSVLDVLETLEDYFATLSSADDGKETATNEKALIEDLILRLKKIDGE
jgi:hypothetical protein